MKRQNGKAKEIPWVAVVEQEPPLRERVLAYHAGERPIVIIARLIQSQWGRKKWMGDSHLFLRSGNYPTHWQPLPAVDGKVNSDR